jgi:FkbM family methyltransferase
MISRENYIKSPIEIEIELLHLFNKNDSLTIFDIGACEAEDAIRYANLFPNAIVYAFEPREDNCIKAQDLIKSNNKFNIVLENIALSNKDGEAEFYLSEGEPGDLKNSEDWDFGNKSSSLFAPSEDMKKHINWLQFNTKIQVQTQRLDVYCLDKKISLIDFVHLDVQGAELLVLEGAGNFLKQIKTIWLEVEAVELYKNQPLKKDVEEFMKKNNFIQILDTTDAVSGDQLYLNSLLFSSKQIEALQTLKNKKSISEKIRAFFKSKKQQ